MDDNEWRRGCGAKKSERGACARPFLAAPTGVGFKPRDQSPWLHPGCRHKYPVHEANVHFISRTMLGEGRQGVEDVHDVLLSDEPNGSLDLEHRLCISIQWSKAFHQESSRIILIDSLIERPIDSPIVTKSTSEHLACGEAGSLRTATTAGSSEDTTHVRHDEGKIGRICRSTGASKA